MHKINFELEFSKYYLDMNTTHLDELLILSDLFNLWIRVRPHFRFGSEIWNWSENFISLGSEKNAWFHMIHFDVKHQKSEAKMKVK